MCFFSLNVRFGTLPAEVPYRKTKQNKKKSYQVYLETSVIYLYFTSTEDIVVALYFKYIERIKFLFKKKKKCIWSVQEK